MLRTTLISLAVLLAACSGPAAEQETAETGETSGEETASPGSAHDVCVTAMTRERECQEAFLPALVALRVRIDNPAGTAERAESEGQEALLSEASTEYATDSTDEAIEANCSQLDEMPQDAADAIIQTETACLEAADCDAFVACQIAFHEARLTGGGA